MTETNHLTLTINGEACTLSAPTDATLLTVVREHLHLTGTKRGCNHGVCGACAMRVDGQEVRSCLMLAAEVGDRAVTTIEGVANEGGLSRVQQTLIDSGAIQCGFCTPGFVIGLTSLFENDTAPTKDEIRAALSGHLCRCSGYIKIIEAAETLAGDTND